MLFILIFSAIFCFFAGLFILFGALKGRKYKWHLSLARIIVALISAVAAAMLATFLSNLVIRLVLNLAITNGWFLEVGNILAELPTGVGVATALASMLVSPILFIPLFFIIKPILNIFGKLISRLIARASDGKTDENGRKIVKRKHYKKRNEALIAHYFNPLGAALGALCSLLVFCIALVPIVGAIDVVNDIVPLFSDTLMEEASEAEGATENAAMLDIAGTALAALNGLDNNVGALTIKYTGGKLLYGAMTTSVINGEMANLNKEGALLASVAEAAVIVLDEEEAPEEKAAAVRAVSPAFDRSVVTRTLISEFCTAAGETWDAGESFHGVARPQLGGDFEAITSAAIDVFATADSQNIKKDVHAITEAVAVLFESGAVGDLQNDPMSILGNEETTSALFAAFLENERLDPMVDGFADFGVNILLDTILTPNTREELYEEFVNGFIGVNGEDAEALTKAYSDIFDDYGIRLDAETVAYAAECKLKGEDMNNWLFMHVAKNKEEFVAKTELVSSDMITGGVTPITNRDHEADALAHAFAVVYGMTSDLKGDSFNTKSLIGKFGPALDSFTMTETIGAEKTGLVLKAVLQSKTVHDQLGMSVIDATNTANSIIENSGKKDYATIMESLTGIIEVLEAASDKGTSTKEAVDKMLDNLTPEAANVMQTMATPNVVKNYGVPENNAEPVANMISDTFGNLQDVPAEEYDKEAAAVADMMNVMMAMGSGGSSSTFGGEESDTQLSADEYVSNVMDSKAMSKTLVDTVYGEGDEPKVDPMNSGRNLASNERAELLESLNSKWAASPKDEATKRQIVAIAAMMNMVVEVTDAGVTEVVPAYLKANDHSRGCL
ncbi:MAG: hypothetical protein IIX25_00580 [Clostridia bacterium]|nr:hypothetical protein [Clostridia bacterium]